MSAAARKKISEAMKRRYAVMNKRANEAMLVGKAGSHLTAAGRRKLSDLMKKSWVKRRKGEAK